MTSWWLLGGWVLIGLGFAAVDWRLCRKRGEAYDWPLFVSDVLLWPAYLVAEAVHRADSWLTGPRREPLALYGALRSHPRRYVEWRGRRWLRYGLCPCCYSSPPLPGCPVCFGSNYYGPTASQPWRLQVGAAWSQRCTRLRGVTR